ncbi:MAG: GDP-mannose 4,6-dehydratase [bacterium]
MCVNSSYFPSSSPRDGTCLRDFVHVKDLARAHMQSLDLIEDLECERLNLGTGDGNTVREVIDTVKQVTGKSFPVKEGERRPGDPARLVASYDRARERLGWEPKRDLKTIIEDAWEWEHNKP